MNDSIIPQESEIYALYDVYRYNYKSDRWIELPVADWPGDLQDLVIACYYAKVVKCDLRIEAGGPGSHGTTGYTWRIWSKRAPALGGQPVQPDLTPQPSNPYVYPDDPFDAPRPWQLERDG